VPSVKTFIALMFIPLYFLSGVLLPSWLLPLQAQRWMSFNPFFQFTELLRTAIFVNYPTAVGVNAPAMAFLSLSLLTVALGLYLARRQSLVSL
jgi:capsular polysaccharide transport system permease protein